MRLPLRGLFPLPFLIVATALSAAPLRVGIDLDGEPMTFLDAKGVPSGFAVDLVNAIAHEMKLEVVYVAKPWAEMLEDFRAHRTDALANITYTTERTRFIDFTDPHVVMSASIFVRKGDKTIAGPGDMRTRRVAVKLGGAPHAYLVAHGWAGAIVPSRTLRDSLRSVAEGRADAALDATVVGTKILRDEHIANVEIAPVELRDFAQRLHIGLQPGDAANVAIFNDGLARLHANGTYDRIYERWIGPLEPRQVQLRALRPYALPAALVVAAIIGAFVWQRHLLRQLARQATALRQSQEQLTLVLEGSEDGFWDWDMRSGRVERSERWAAMLGYTLADISPNLAAGDALVHLDDRHLLDQFRSVRSPHDASGSNIELRMRTKSGEWRWLLKRGKVVARAADGTPLRMAGTHTDITDLKRTREELVRQESRFRFIFEHVPVGISWLERRQAGSRLVNPAHARISGVTAAQSRDTKNYVAASHPDDRERQQKFEDRLYAGEIDHFAMEKRYVHPDGRVVWTMLTMHLYSDPITGAVQEVTTLVDVDELKRAEGEREALRLKMLETQKLESLGVLAGGIAHDFNNLLTVILGNATLARDPNDTEGDDRLKQIELAAGRAADLCRQMLAYAGRGNFMVQRIDLSNLVRDTANLLSVSISKKARVVLDLTDHLPAVNADPSQLRQVVMNLVINASEAQGDQPGDIRIHTRLGRPAPNAGVIHSFDLPEGPCVCLEIADTGQGMTEATIAKIFDPFFTTKFTGRGLGLAAVLGIVRAHQGALAVESEPGRGSIFRLFIPVGATPVPAPALSSGTNAPIPPRSDGTILIADDEPAVLAAADLILRHHGYTPVRALDGNEAVRLFQEDPKKFRAVLLDLTMPGLDGAEVLRTIRTIRPDIAALVMSGYSEQDVKNRLQGLGPVAILRKPFTRDVLLARLADAIKKENA